MSDPLPSNTLLDTRPSALPLFSGFLIVALTALCLFAPLDTAFRQDAILLLGVAGFGTLICMILRQNRERNYYLQTLKSLQNQDCLTGLSNRQLFLSSVYERLKAAEYQRQSFALLLLDIDRFKELNTILGTENGDLILQEFASRLAGFQANDNFVARLSGNEFAILLDDETFEFSDQIENIRQQLLQPYGYYNRPIDITLSGGYVQFPQDGYQLNALLQRAKMALLRAKQSGRDQICCFEHRQDVRAHMSHELSQEMSKSITRGEFCLHYQPQYSMTTGALIGFEALMRWDHPVRGWVSPADFIPIAERNGHILALSEYALREACRTAANWARPLTVAVNLSPIQFAKTDLVELVGRVLGETGLPAERLELEVTESLFLQTSKRTSRQLEQLRAMGISIALDDFGTGYSSLSYLSAFPLDKIKIDRSFVRDLAQNSGNMAIISAMIGISKSLDLQITAEGIEDKHTLDLLHIAGCHIAQGYYLGRPRDLVAEPGEEMKPQEQDVALLESAQTSTYPILFPCCA